MPTYDTPMLNYTSMPINTIMPLTLNQNYQSNSASNRQKTTQFKTTNLKLGSLNCRSLASTSDASTCQKFTRYLRFLKYNLLSFQEVRNKGSNILDYLNIELQAKDSIWSQHVGIVSFNPNIRITPIFITHTKHAVFVKVHHINHHFEPIFLLNLSAPSQPSDFNYHHYTSYRSSNSPSPHPIISWKQIISQQLYDCINSDIVSEMFSIDNPHITFSRRNSRTTIDYIFGSLAIKASMTPSGVDFINTDWTDYAVLCIDLVLVSENHGKGICLANPTLSKNKRFVEQLFTLLQDLEPDPAHGPHNSPQKE
ncbi:hypothetical protein INT47_009789 [Mucor saturninus]|uniref:Uncharacterized protein n=1 Tax=Mucor saturninus TaxID=64648 RepID=A0A8H7V1T7_9FUNG|nr:hypothetical protein INT47_009789 [Mucor saturninus]